jgi:hypothetical protein
MIENGDTSSFALIDEQIVARNMILDKIRKMVRAENGEYKKSVVIVKGGPGTGKTVIALHLMAELSKFINGNHGLNEQYATKSKPLLEGVRYQIRPGARFMFHNVLNYIPNLVKPNSVDVLLVDEAHRIQNTPNHQYTKPENRTDSRCGYFVQSYNSETIVSGTDAELVFPKRRSEYGVFSEGSLRCLLKKSVMNLFAW